MSKNQDSLPDDQAVRAIPIVRTVTVLAWAGLLLTYLVAIPVGLIPAEDRLGTPEVILVAAILIAGVLAQNGLSIRDLTLGTSGVSAHFERIEQHQAKVDSEIRALQIAVTGLVTKYEFLHLQKLASDGPAMVHFGNIMLDELTHLDAMQFLRPVDPRGLNAIRFDQQGSADDFDLKRYSEITQEGREYLLLRAQLAAREAAAQIR